MGQAIANPNPVLLVNHETEGREQMAGIFLRLAGMVHKNKLRLVRIALGQMHNLGILDIERPNISIGRRDDALH